MNRTKWSRSRLGVWGMLLVLSAVLGVPSGLGCTVRHGGDGDEASSGARRGGDGGKSANGGTSSTDAGDGSGGSNAPGVGGADDGEGGDTGGSVATGGTGHGGEPGQGGDGAGEGGAGGEGSGVPGAEPGTWTYLVYMLADNDLEPFALQDLEELMEVGSGGKLTILVQVDRAVGEATGAIGGLGDFTGAKRVRVERDRLVELSDLGEVNMGESETLAEFVAWGVATAPAEHYALVFWDHGAAWPQFGADFSHRNDGLTLPELQRGLDAGIAATDLLGPLDLVGFDACLMATWEIGVALRGRARYLLASEEVEPGHGWDHRAIALLRQGAEPEALGRALLDGYADQAREAGTFAGVTLSLTDVRAVSRVTAAIEGLTAAVTTNGIREQAPFIGRSRARAPTFGSIPGAESSQMTDLLLFVEGLADLEPAFDEQAAQVRAALERAVIDQVAGVAYQGVGGLSIYLPPTRQRYSSTYDALDGVGPWREFLKSFYGAATTIGDGPKFTHPDGVADVRVVGDELIVSGQLAPGSFEDLVDAIFEFGLYVEDATDATFYFLGETPANVSATGEVVASWDGQALMVLQDGLEEYAFYALHQPTPDVLSLSIPFGYIEDGALTSVVLLLSFDADGDLLSHAFYAPTDGAWAELVPAAGSSLVTLVPVVVASRGELEWQPQATEFDATLGLDLEFTPLPSGLDFFVRLLAIDFADQQDDVMAVGTL